jgi:isopenicillin-N epimerase
MAPSPEELRSLFLLDPSVIFLNHGSFGAVPRPVFEAQERLRREMEAEPVVFLARTLDERLAAVRAEIAGLVGAGDPSDVVLVPNTTTGLNAVALSLGLERGDEVVLTSHEYGAMVLLWEEVARLTGCVLRVAALPEPAQSEDEIVAAIGAAMTARTRVLFFSHVTSLSTIVLPAERLCAEARRLDVTSVVDGAHAPGQLPLDLDRLGADVYVGNLHKWLCSPRGSAFLYAHPGIRDVIRAPIVSWGWTWEAPGGFQSRYGWQGTIDPTAWLAVPATMAFRREHDWDAVIASCRERLERTVAALEEGLGGVPAAGPALRPPQLAAVHVDIGGRDPDAVREALWERRRIEVPVERIGSLTVVRPSVQGYVTDADLDALVETLADVLR